jgi:hypothetical protein
MNIVRDLPWKMITAILRNDNSDNIIMMITAILKKDNSDKIHRCPECRTLL